MSAKLKFLLIVVFSLFATAATGIYMTQRQPSAAVPLIENGQPHQFFTASNPEEMVANPDRAKYNPIPLESINSSLRGSDPADLALSAFDNIKLRKGPRKVEVYYPYPNHALVTITQMKQDNDSVKAIKYRVELTTFGRALLVRSPRVWQINWAGSQEQCIPGSPINKCKV